MSLNRTPFKGYNRGLDQPNVDEEIFFDDVRYDSWASDWDDDGYYDYYDSSWEYELECFRDRESDEEFYNKALSGFELELMEY